MVVDRKLPPSSQAKKARVTPKMPLLQSPAGGYFTCPLFCCPCPGYDLPGITEIYFAHL